MKTVKNKRTGELTREKDEVADNLVHVKKTHSFVPKGEWKKIRDAAKA